MLINIVWFLLRGKGGPQIRFSIGADDRQSLQPPISPTLPVTRLAVALLLNQLGKSSLLITRDFCDRSLLEKVPLTFYF